MTLSTDEAAMLAACRTAYAALITGRMVAKVTSGGRTMEYSQADKGALRSEIDRLEALALTGPCRPRRGAVRFSL